MENTDPLVDVEINYAPSGKMTEQDQFALSDLVGCVNESGLTTENHITFRKSLELPIVVGIAIHSVFALLKLFGVSDYFKTRMTERAKYQSALANKKRVESRISESPFVKKLSDLRSENKGVIITVGVPSPFNYTGGLAITGPSTEEIASQIEGLIFHSQALVDLINSEIMSSKIIGGVYLRPLPNGDLKVKWMLRGDGQIVSRILRREG